VLHVEPAPTLRYRIGVAVLILALLLPWTAPLVAFTTWSTSVKAAVGGTVVMSFEILVGPAVLLLGREGYRRLKRQALAKLRQWRASVFRRTPHPMAPEASTEAPPA
jgi:hypothetical protein